MEVERQELERFIDLVVDLRPDTMRVDFEFHDKRGVLKIIFKRGVFEMCYYITYLEIMTSRYPDHTARGIVEYVDAIWRLYPGADEITTHHH